MELTTHNSELKNRFSLKTNMKLHELKAGQKAVIRYLDMEHLPMKVVEMGCFPGSEVELILKAPLGDPYYLRVDGMPLCMRRDMAMQVDVELLSNGTHGI